MTPTVEQVIATAVAQRGYREQPTNRTSFARELDAAVGPFTLWNGTKVTRDGYEWCAIFCCWAYWKVSGELLPIPSGGFYTPVDVNAWRAQGRLVTSPQPGDLVYYLRNGMPYHVGLVIEVNGSWYSSIEGNTSPSTVVNPNGGGVFQFGPYRGAVGDVPQRPVSGDVLFARPWYSTPQDTTEEVMHGWQDKRFKNVFYTSTGFPVAPADVDGLPIRVEDPGHDPKLAACCRVSWGVEGGSPSEVVARATEQGYLFPA
jgi:hypothetical protein